MFERNTRITIKSCARHVFSAYLMESVVRWKKGEPDEAGFYLVTTSEGMVTYERYRKYEENEPARRTYHSYYTNIIAHCRMRDIEPYKDDER